MIWNWIKGWFAKKPIVRCRDCKHVVVEGLLGKEYPECAVIWAEYRWDAWNGKPVPAKCGSSEANFGGHCKRFQKKEEKDA